MADPTNPRLTGFDPDNLVWPDLIPDPGPPDPRLYAWAMENHGRAPADRTPWPGSVAAVSGSADEPPHLLMAKVIAAQPRPAFLAPADDPPPPPSTTPPYRMPVSQSVPANPAGEFGAMPADQTAAPSAAVVPSSGSGAQAPGSAPQPVFQIGGDASGLPLRSELSGGPDALVAAMAGANPNHNPSGFFVDPRTGSVSRLRMGRGGDPLHPNAPVLEPVGPQEKQVYLEWLTGARANYPLGATSPQEQTARYQLQQGALPGASGPPLSAVASGKTVTYALPDGGHYALPGEHPNRDQNPRNIEAGNFAIRHGAIGQDSKVAIFPSEEQAYQASMALMSSMAANGKAWPGYPAGSLANIVRQWSPPTDNNNTEGIIKDIMTMTGFDRNASFESLTSAQKDAFVRAYARREGYQPNFPELPREVR